MAALFFLQTILVLFVLHLSASSAAIQFPVTMFYNNTNLASYDFTWSCIDAGGSTQQGSLPVIPSIGSLCPNNGFNNQYSPCSSQIVSVSTMEASLFSCVFQLYQVAIPRPYLLYTAQQNNGAPITSYSISVIIAPVAFNVETGYVPQIFVYSSLDKNTVNVGVVNLYFTDPITVGSQDSDSAGPGPSCFQMTYTLMNSASVTITNTLGSICSQPTMSPTLMPTNPTAEPTLQPTTGPTNVTAPTPEPTIKPIPTLMPTQPVPTRAPNTPTQSPTVAKAQGTLQYGYTPGQVVGLGESTFPVSSVFSSITFSNSGSNLSSTNGCAFGLGLGINNVPAFWQQPGQLTLLVGLGAPLYMPGKRGCMTNLFLIGPPIPSNSFVPSMAPTLSLEPTAEPTAKPTTTAQASSKDDNSSSSNSSSVTLIVLLCILGVFIILIIYHRYCSSSAAAQNVGESKSNSLASKGNDGMGQELSTKLVKNNAV